MSYAVLSSGIQRWIADYKLGKNAEKIVSALIWSSIPVFVRGNCGKPRKNSWPTTELGNSRVKTGRAEHLTATFVVCMCLLQNYIPLTAGTLEDYEQTTAEVPRFGGGREGGDFTQMQPDWVLNHRRYASDVKWS